MNILLAVASKHGSTREIGDTIAEVLTMAGHSTDVRNAAEVRDLAAYDAVIVGSAIYMGNWMADARRFVTRNQVQLSRMPVWLFSSGPLGQDEPKPEGDFASLDDLMRATSARGHRTFVGKLDNRHLKIGELLITKVVKAPDGDFRDWEAIRSWAIDIASALAAQATVSV